jgi:hypothetical protein
MIKRIVLVTGGRRNASVATFNALEQVRNITSELTRQHDESASAFRNSLFAIRNFVAATKRFVGAPSGRRDIGALNSD